MNSFIGAMRCFSDEIFRVCALICLLGLASCGDDNKKEGGTSSSAESAQNKKTEVKKVDKVAPASGDVKKVEAAAPAQEPVNAGDSVLLPAYRLDNLTAPLALVKVPGKPDIQGIIIQGAPRNVGGGIDYILICGAPEETKSVDFVCKSSSNLVYSTAKKISSLPSGLSVFGFTASSYVQTCRFDDPSPSDTFHAIRIGGDGKLSDVQLAKMQEEIKILGERIAEAQHKLDETMRMPPGRPQYGDPRDRMVSPQNGGSRDMMQDRNQRMQALETANREISTLKQEERNLVLSIDSGIASLKASEKGAFSAIGIKPKKTSLVEDTVLIASSGSVVAIRCKDNWVNLKTEVANSGKIIRHADISVTGGESQLSVTCQLHPLIPTNSATFVMVAETTQSLETRGSGTIQERLATVEPVNFQSTGSSMKVNKQVDWKGMKTSLWLKVFDPAEPTKLILDEVIAIDYPGMLSVRWEKEPSPIISIPPSQPDMPEDVVRDKKSLDAKGTIMDLVAAGDGSVLAVRTNREPFWALLDLKKGEWLPVPWKATEKTLLASQAGKIHLFDSQSMVVQTWGLESGKREGLQILQLPDPILAVAAPLSDAEQPLFVATAKGAWFLDPVKFEPIPCGLDARRFFSEGPYASDKQQPLDTATMCVRASSDGTLYSLSCRRTGATKRMPERITVCLDRTPLVVQTLNDGFIGSKGRDLESKLPDHGGRGLSMSPSAAGARFPSSTGEIRINGSSRGESIALIRNPAVLPDESGRLVKPFPADRGAYLDSVNSVLLLPDGDRLHFMRLALPVIPDSTPAFLLAGQTFEIPLPPGSGHKLTASTEGGKFEITATHARWIAPKVDNENTYRLKLEWTGELGSPISNDYNVKVVRSSPEVEVISPDGSRKIPLQIRGIINNMGHSISGYAGSGSIAFSRSSEFSAWNLWTCERIFSSKESSMTFFGDADYIYELNHDKKLTSYDIQTGKKLAEQTLGNGVRFVATGISSRSPLLAIESGVGEGYLLEISRNTLKSEIVDLPVDLRRLFFSQDFKVNATGSAAWSGRGIGIFRDERAITVTPYPNELANRVMGVPDISGKFIVDGRQILNIAEKPFSLVPIPDLVDNSVKSVLDPTGRYLLVEKPISEEKAKHISVREVANPSKELFKIRYTRGSSGQQPILAAGANALLAPTYFGGNESTFIYELDVSAIVKKFSN